MKGNATIGIDIAKKRHQVCVIDADGNFIGKSFHFENTTSGVEAFLKTVSARVSISEATIGFEATGHYWLPLYHALKRRGICPIVINPAQTKAFSNLELRRVKTDPKDASHIARLMRYGRFSKAYVPEGVVYELRRLTRLRYFLADHRKIMMRRMEACLDVVFPEFENLFRNNFTPTPIQLLSQYTTPKEMLTAGHSPLCNLLKSASRGHLGEDKAKDILLRATKTIGIPDHDEVHKAEITSMISLTSHWMSMAMAIPTSSPAQASARWSAGCMPPAYLHCASNRWLPMCRGSIWSVSSCPSQICATSPEVCRWVC